MHLCQIALIDQKAIKFVRASLLIQLYVIVIYLLKVTVSRVCLRSTSIIASTVTNIELPVLLFVCKTCYRLFLLRQANRKLYYISAVYM